MGWVLFLCLDTSRKSYRSEGFALTGYVVPGCAEDGTWMLWENSSVTVVVVAILAFPCLENDVSEKSYVLVMIMGNLLLGAFMSKKVVFVSSYLHSRDLLRLQLALGQLPYPCTPIIEPHDVPTNMGMREKINLQGDKNPFEKILTETLPKQIPKAYVEAYSNLKQRAMAAFPKKPKVIYTTNGFWGNEGFNFWAASNVAQGTSLVGSPHGGSQGAVAWSATEQHEISVCDYYFSWGWEKSDQPKVIPISSGQLAGLMPEIKPDPEGMIIWLGTAVTRYSSQLVSVPMGRQMLDYLNFQQRFAQAVSPSVHRLLVRRLFPMNYDWDEELRWKEMDPHLTIYKGNKSMYQQLNESRLCIGTYNSTTHLETLSRNFPTITYYDPKFNELRELAKPYFEDLRQAGILHETPESAAAKVNEVYMDPLSWWNSAEVQDVKKKFCYRFARTNENWISEWKDEFKRIIKK